MKKDQAFIAGLEKEISKKYGAEAAVNPRKYWDEEKEKEYLRDAEHVAQKARNNELENDKVFHEGILVNKKLLNKEINRDCPVCRKYSFNVQDGLYINKFDCCFNCYIKWVETREERWLSGWRPKQ